MYEKEPGDFDSGTCHWVAAYEQIIASQEYWDAYFFDILQAVSKKSKDPNTKVGCIIIGEGREIKSTGYNSFPRGLNDNIPERLARPEKYSWIIHAEQNALCDCAKRGVSCDGCIAYITHYPCIICTRLLLASGIKEIKYINDYKNDALVDFFCKQMNIEIKKI